MPNVVFVNVNTQASVAMINKLEQLHRSGFPLAVRGTLNAAALDVKTRTLDISAREHFIRRSPTFFKRFSGVNLARGWDINAMQATVGMTAETGGADAQRAQTAISNMPKQEEGGQIADGLDYMPASRISSLGAVRRKMRWSNMAKLSNGNSNTYTWKGKHQLTGGTTKSRQINALFMAAYTQKVMRIKKGDRSFYIQVSAIEKTGINKFKIDSKLLYVSRNEENRAVAATHFSRDAAKLTQPRIPAFFNVQAKKQIDRLWK